MVASSHHWHITSAQKGLRLDKFLCGQLPDLSRSYVQQLLADGHLLRDGATVTSGSAKVKPGERYQLTIPEVVPLALEPVPMALDIIYEDDALIIINKPSGLAVHPAAGTYAPTLVHGLLAHCADSLSGIGGVARPGIVHRIDKDTSGLLVVAKTDIAHQHLSAQLKDRSLSRTYTAICWDVPNPLSGSIEGNIGRSPKDRKKMAVLATGGKTARTHYAVDEIFHAQRGREQIAVASLLTCKLESGRTHQIRVHFNHIGHGLLGDPVYGSNTLARLRKFGLTEIEPDCFLMNYRRQALHAAKLALHHPITGKHMEFLCPLPDDLIELVNSLKDLHK